MARRSDHSKDEIREMALAAASALADRHGLSGISARKVATDIGYTVGTLYLVFKNLDDVILHVNAQTLDQLFSQLREATQDCKEPTQCILAMARAYVGFATRYPKRWSMVFEHNLPEGEPVPDWLALKVNDMFELVETQLISLIPPQHEIGVGGSDLVNNSTSERQQVSRTIWCGVHGICALAVTGKLEIGGAESINVLTDSLIKNYLAGLAGSRGEL
ncbi:MAG: TetR/AcrR family transcriptional regulator [Gammaproteobacteria bacterium]|nr:TetR/AcrR family transcriptional regulator [Gammaproteobacteria bacterium]MDH5799300.1 TetR/AcrR family transcriptional regulator [Gammaproteobacteria bacterium]